MELANSANVINPMLVLWSADGSIGLLIPINRLAGWFNLNIAFQGDIDAEAPCITQNGYGVTESVPVGSISMGPVYFRPHDPIIVQSVEDAVLRTSAVRSVPVIGKSVATPTPGVLPALNPLGA